VSRTAQTQPLAGSFASSRRGGLTSDEIRMAEALRARERPVSFQNIAARLGRCEADVRRHFEPAIAVAPVEVATPQPPKPVLVTIRDPNRAKSGRPAPYWSAEELAIMARVQNGEQSIRGAALLLKRVPSNVRYWIDRGVGLAPEARAA